MLKRVKISELRPGMHVVLPAGWLKHPFLKNSFTIRSEGQIKKLKESGLEYVMIDPRKGALRFSHAFSLDDAWGQRSGEEDQTGGGARAVLMEAPGRWEPDKLVPRSLLDAIRNSGMGPAEKAGVVYRSSLTLMERLFEEPRAENIKEAKKAIKDVVDLILCEPSTANELLKITVHDFYTYTHSVNVGVLAVLLSKSFTDGLAGEDMHELGAGFFLHDLGKVKVDSSIINKRGKLTPEEMEEIKKHPQTGCDMVTEAGELSRECRTIIMQHHERIDGSGYPVGLKDREILLAGHICAVADVYDALTSTRSYQRRLTAFQALKYMKESLEGKFLKEAFEELVLLFAPG